MHGRGKGTNRLTATILIQITSSAREQRESQMHQTAKIFSSDHGQALRLPLEFHFDLPEVFIRRDPATGDVVLSRKPTDWQGLREVVTQNKDDDSPPERRQTQTRRDPFEGSQLCRWDAKRSMQLNSYLNIHPKFGSWTRPSGLSGSGLARRFRRCWLLPARRNTQFRGRNCKWTMNPGFVTARSEATRQSMHSEVMDCRASLAMTDTEAMDRHGLTASR